MKTASIGRVAAQVAAHGGDAQVIGVTSRGIFLALDRRVLFVSFERWRGPLTINVDKPLECAIGANVLLSQTRLIFPATEIDLSAAEVWQPTVPTFTRPIADQLEALRHLASSVLARKTPDGFGVLLPHLLDLPEKQALSADEAARLARLNQLRESIQRGNWINQPIEIEGLLGLGRGLTPSGDDVTIGLLLMLKRAPSLRMNSQPDNLNALKRVVESAYQRTTTISANLIECAADGETDERLINVLDGLVTGTPSRDDCVECVIGWGNSSGLDALIGMALTLSGV